jgi:hypothetical protein
MRYTLWFVLVQCVQAYDCLVGKDFLKGIRDIIGNDPSVSEGDVYFKPFTGSFTNIQGEDDQKIQQVSYCLTDSACGHWEAYSRTDIPLSELSCNQFCFIDSATKKYVPSSIYSPHNPPEAYLSCGWETCS